MVALRNSVKKRTGKASAQRSQKKQKRSYPISEVNHKQDVIDATDFDRLTPDAVIRLQRTIGNRATTQLLNRKTAQAFAPQPITADGMAAAAIQRDYDDDTYATLPYDSSQKPPAFEYWVNSMWGEVKNVESKKTALALMKGTETVPRAGSALDETAKKAVLDELYRNAYQEKVWYSAEKLISEGSLVHEIQVPTGSGSSDTRSETIAAGYHGTWRDPDTVLSSHKGTIPTIERHGKDKGDKAGIQEYMKNKLGIGEWHPFWFGGDITNRPFLFRNKQEDNELDTTISVAKSAKDSLDFPMIESMDKKDIKGYDEHGMPITETYVYLVGVTQGYGTTVNLQGENAFGEGEMATLGLKPDDHLGYVRYRRVHAGGSRNDGYRYKGIFKAALPGARAKRITDKVNAILDTMPSEGINRTDESKLNYSAMYEELKKVGTARANGALKTKSLWGRTKWTDTEWRKVADVLDPIKTAPTEQAKELRLKKFIEGVRSVIPKAFEKTG